MKDFIYDRNVIPFGMPIPVASEGLRFAHIACEIYIRAAVINNSGNFPFSINVNLVPPNQCELSDCQEVIENIIYIWDLPVSPFTFGLLWYIDTIYSGPQGP